jgi:hypothetical protein
MRGRIGPKREPQRSGTVRVSVRVRSRASLRDAAESIGDSLGGLSVLCGSSCLGVFV